MPMPRFRRQLIAIILLWLTGIGPLQAYAATNSVLGGVGGINNGTLLGGDGTGTAQITINAVDLALVKQSRDLAGTVLPDGSTVTPGQTIYFVLYVDNITSYQTGDLRITDLLNETEFTYIPDSLETTLVPTGSSDAAIWGAAWNVLSDAAGGPDDIASITDSGGPAGKDKITIGAVPGQVNQQLYIPASSLRAVRFKVTVN